MTSRDPETGELSSASPYITARDTGSLRRRTSGALSAVLFVSAIGSPGIAATQGQDARLQARPWARWSAMERYIVVLLGIASTVLVAASDLFGIAFTALVRPLYAFIMKYGRERWLTWLRHAVFAVVFLMV